MSIIDKIVGAISPQAGLRRQVAKRQLEILNSGYSHHGASRSKKALLGWLSKGGSPDEDVVDNLPALRERSRDLFMGGPLTAGALKTIRTNVVGAGLRLDPRPDATLLGWTEEQAKAWEAQVEREWKLWANSDVCDATRTANFGEMQGLALLSMLMSGDVFALLPVIPRNGSTYDLRVWLLEADRVCDPMPLEAGRNIKAGIEVGRYGEPISYYIAQKHPLSSSLKRQEWKRVSAFGAQTGRRNVIHLFEQDRPEQRRGVPLVAPIIESLKQLTRYSEAELMAAVISGMFTTFIKSTAPEGALGESLTEEEQSQVQSDDPNAYQLAPGAMISLAPGESIDTANPGRPNAGFDAFVVAICRQIGAAIEVPYELLVKHFTASYSASRAALLEAWKMFRMRRAFIASKFCQPIYEEWLSEAVAKGRISAPGFFADPLIRAAYCGAEWHGPSQGQIDPLKEVNAAKIRVEEGFSTRARETAELTGGSWDEMHSVRVREEQMRREGGLIILDPGATLAGGSAGGNQSEGSNEQ